jgi:hypothetical protein
VLELNRIHTSIYAQCVNLSADIRYPHSRACQLIGSFLLGFTYCDVRERESDRNIIFRWSCIAYLIPGFHILTTSNVFFYIWLWYKRERTSKHSAIWFILRATTCTPPRTNQIASWFDALFYCVFCLFKLDIIVIFIDFWLLFSVHVFVVTSSILMPWFNKNWNWNIYVTSVKRNNSSSALIA